MTFGPDCRTIGSEVGDVVVTGESVVVSFDSSQDTGVSVGNPYAVGYGFEIDYQVIGELTIVQTIR